MSLSNLESLDIGYKSAECVSESHSSNVGRTTPTMSRQSHPLSRGFSSRNLGGIILTSVLTLNANEHLESTLFRLKKNEYIRFLLGASLFGRKITLFTNHPLSHQPSSNSFYRDQFRMLQWEHEARVDVNTDDSALYAEFQIIMSGSFDYYFTEQGCGDKLGSGCFVVEPILTCGADYHILPLDCVQCQTYLTKCLGTLDEWDARLKVAKKAGYNMVHFTPVQELGKSWSAYSVRDQLKINPMFSEGKSESYAWKDLALLIDNMRSEWRVLSICDIVLNHTSNDSPWLQEHPESAHNLQNSPHLRPAFILDRIINRCSNEIAEGKWSHWGLPAEINNEDHLQVLKNVLFEKYLNEANLFEFFMLNVDEVVGEYREQLQQQSGKLKRSKSNLSLHILPETIGKGRYKSSVNFEVARHLFNCEKEDKEVTVDVESGCKLFRDALETLNRNKFNEIEFDLKIAIDNVISGVRYYFVDENGPRLGKVTVENSIVPRYFHCLFEEHSLEEEIRLCETEKTAPYIMAHNGWVMGDDALKNFAENDSKVYFCRQLIAWGDSVKLRYGKTPKDSPYLWDRMKEYSELMAKLFHGVRLDNCHSTPIHVAQYMVDAARRIRPDLYVVAELFTSSEATDNIFVNRLGINSLIRENLSAHDCRELGRLIFKYGGEPVGSFQHLPSKPLYPSVAHALLMDVTHDNPSPIQKRSVYDMFASSALVSMASCATGSSRGYDELVPYHVHVVNESRKYCSLAESSHLKSGFVNANSGIMLGKKAVNWIHNQLGLGKFTEVYVDQLDENICAVTRHCPRIHQSVIMVARTAFKQPENPDTTGLVPSLTITGTIDEIIFEAKIVKMENHQKYFEDPNFITGYEHFYLDIKERVSLLRSEVVEVSVVKGKANTFEVDFMKFPPGSVVVFKVSLPAKVNGVISQIRGQLNTFGYWIHGAGHTPAGRSKSPSLTLQQIVSQLTLSDVNRVLFRCAAEETDEGWGGGAYDVPGIGPFIYCGLQGLMTMLDDLRHRKDMGHPLCENLRQGNWLMDYTSNRLLKYAGTKRLGVWLEETFELIKQFPTFLIPAYFDAIISGVYRTILKTVHDNMGEFVMDGSPFVKELTLASLQFVGYVQSSLLPPLSPDSTPAANPCLRTNNDAKVPQVGPSLAAGLPHFAVGYMRNWGRDTFISLRGLLMITSRFDEARFLILGYAGCLRHGLIPNLLDGGQNARFNCRDAVWFWLQCIQDYTVMAPLGFEILSDKVGRLYPADDTIYNGKSHIDQCLYDVIQEALTVHLHGKEFRERNAGTRIDSQMNDAGFNVRIGVDPETGFVYGGNEWNCGTWMDKMGSSEKARNKGVPATPRDGSAVELVGICYSTLLWLEDMHAKGHYPYTSIEDSGEITIGRKPAMTFSDWAKKIKANFEICFFVPPLLGLSANEQCKINDQHVNRRGIYKDTYGSSKSWTDYQLRPNICVAMAVAPSLFNKTNARVALQSVRDILLGPLGMKTLDPSDFNYNGDYVNSDDSDNYNTARGFNYHQGPEWVWPVGYFLRAWLNFFDRPEEHEETYLFIKKTLGHHHAHIISSPWRGIPELTNSNGKECPDSCPTQAWSVSCILDVLYDLYQLANASQATF